MQTQLFCDWVRKSKPVIERPPFKRIELTQGYFTYVDPEEYDNLMQWKWRAQVNKYKGRIKNVYAVRTENFRLPCGKWSGKIILMHKYLMQSPKGMQTDHILNDSTFNELYPELIWNGLLNIKSNLRIVTNGQNQGNSKSSHGSSSKFKGVYWNKKSGKWMSRITFNRKIKYLGLFTDESEAARRYDLAASKVFGEFANFNFPEEWEFINGWWRKKL